MPFTYLYYILISFLISLIITPLAFKFLRRFNILDKPNNRKIHKSEILTGGGIIIFLTFLLSITFPFTSLLGLLDEISGISAFDSIFLFELSNLNFIRSFFIGFSLLFLMGMLDDKFNLNSKIKFLTQIISLKKLIYFRVFHKYPQKKIENPIKTRFFKQKNASL